MGKPTETEYQMALDEAARIREAGEDPHFIGKSLLNLDYRFQHLVKVYETLEHWLNSGQAAHEHSELMMVLEKYRRLDRVPDEEKDTLL